MVFHMFAFTKFPNTDPLAHDTMFSNPEIPVVDELAPEANGSSASGVLLSPEPDTEFANPCKVLGTAASNGDSVPCCVPAEDAAA